MTSTRAQRDSRGPAILTAPEPPSPWDGVDWGETIDWYDTLDDLPDLPDLPEKLTAAAAPSGWAARRRGRQRAADAGPARRVLLLDLDNVCSGRRRSGAARDELDRLISAAGPLDEILAVGNRKTTDGRGALLDQMGIAYQTVRNSPDAADQRLISEARRAARSGRVEFVVASADHAFADIAALGRLTVLELPGRPMADRLRRAAHEVLSAA